MPLPSGARKTWWCPSPYLIDGVELGGAQEPRLHGEVALGAHPREQGATVAGVGEREPVGVNGLHQLIDSGGEPMRAMLVSVSPDGGFSKYAAASRATGLQFSTATLVASGPTRFWPGGTVSARPRTTGPSSTSIVIMRSVSS